MSTDRRLSAAIMHGLSVSGLPRPAATVFNKLSCATQVIEEKLTLLYIVATHEAFISGRRSRAMFAGIVKVNFELSASRPWSSFIWVWAGHVMPFSLQGSAKSKVQALPSVGIYASADRIQ